MRVDGRIRLEYAMCGRGNFWIRKEKVADSKISGYVWTRTGPKSLGKVWLGILVANLASNFQDFVTKVKNLVAFAPVLGAFLHPAFNPFDVFFWDKRKGIDLKIVKRGDSKGPARWPSSTSSRGFSLISTCKSCCWAEGRVLAILKDWLPWKPTRKHWLNPTESLVSKSWLGWVLSSSGKREIFTGVWGLLDSKTSPVWWLFINLASSFWRGSSLQ